MAENNVYGGSFSAFPAGLRVLLVDDDLTCLSFLASLLQACHYQVTTCRRGTEALSLLRENESKFDIVISDLYIPDMDGFQFLEVIQLEMDLPVVMMSNDDSRDVVMKVILMGACDYLVKPVRKEEISVIWQHVVRKHKNDSKSFMLSEISPGGEEYRNKSSPGEENCGSSNNVKNDEEEGSKNDIVSLKKQRMVWTTELHEQFVAAVNEIGLKNAVPKKILELMKVPDLTRENVASHLQKYRIYLRRKTENIGKKFINSSSQIQNVMHPCMVGSSTASQAYAMPNQLQSRSSVVSQAEVEPERLSVVAGGLPINQGNYYNQPWCYGLQVNLPPSHGTPPTAIEPEQDEFTTMQREQALNENGTMHFSLPIPSLIVDVGQNDQGYNLSSYDCSPDGTSYRNASFATVGNSQSDYTYSCSSYDSVFLVQHYNQEDLTEN